MRTHTTPTPRLTIAEAARFCGVSTKTLRRAVRARRLAYLKPARAYLFTVLDLESYMDAHRFSVVVFGTAALGLDMAFGVDNVEEAPADLQRLDTATEGTGEKAVEDVLDAPLDGAFCHAGKGSGATLG